jgi:hypothetical protein
MAEDKIRYDLRAQNALRNVIREVLAEVAQTGLPGDHHFYIAFSTKADGVVVSPRLMEQHPDDMTIVLQHQFWDFKVTDTGFEVSLSFNNVPEHLKIPFSAIKSFFDPSVQFGLQFEPREPQPETGAEPAALPVEPLAAESGEKPPKDAGKGEDKSGDAASAEIVRLDTFRKKN